MTAPPPERRRVLLVDDDEDVRSTLRLVLEDDGWEVAIAEDGEAALVALGVDPGSFALVMVDLMMPRLGGVGFLKRKALDPALAAIPVVVVSAIPDMTPIPETPDLRAVLHKPVSTAELLGAARAAVRAPAARPAARGDRDATGV